MNSIDGVLSKLCHQLQQENYQKVKNVLKNADSVVGDEFDELHAVLNVRFPSRNYAILGHFIELCAIC